MPANPGSALLNILVMTELDLAGKRVLIREDLNVPLEGGSVASDARIRAALPTIRQALEKNAAVILLSHLGRPTEGETDAVFSLAPVAERLTQLLGHKVPLVRNWLDGVDVEAGNLVLCENVRFNAGEKSNDEMLSRKIAALCDIFVMDAFGTAHRTHASTHGVARFAAVACAGPLLVSELMALTRALDDPKRPLVAIVGGAKVSTKLEVLTTLVEKVDRLIVGGGIANTFIAAAGHQVGNSLYEPDLVDTARHLLERASERGAEIPLPPDVVVATEFAATAEADLRAVEDIGEAEMIMDIGPDASEANAVVMADAGTIVWNGPLGVFEFDQFSQGTRTLVNAIAESSAFSLAGGGDTLAAIDRYGVRDRISYISTGGGAFLEFLEGKNLPAVTVLEQRAANRQ